MMLHLLVVKQKIARSQQRQKGDVSFVVEKRGEGHLR